MSQTKNHCEPPVAVWLRPSTTEPCICCKQVAEKPRWEHLKNDVSGFITCRCISHASQEYPRIFLDREPIRARDKHYIYSPVKVLNVHV